MCHTAEVVLIKADESPAGAGFWMIRLLTKHYAPIMQSQQTHFQGNAKHKHIEDKERFNEAVSQLGRLFPQLLLLSFSLHRVLMYVFPFLVLLRALGRPHTVCVCQCL